MIAFGCFLLLMVCRLFSHSPSPFTWLIVSIHQYTFTHTSRQTICTHCKIQLYDFWSFWSSINLFFIQRNISTSQISMRLIITIRWNAIIVSFNSLYKLSRFNHFVKRGNAFTAARLFSRFPVWRQIMDSHQVAMLCH